MCVPRVALRLDMQAANLLLSTMHCKELQGLWTAEELICLNLYLYTECC